MSGNIINSNLQDQIANIQLAPGPTGAAGEPGPQGLVGATGPMGAQCATGPPGAQGAPGAAGGTCPPGAQGDVGATGSQGSVGAQGTQGATGAQGPQGDVGAQGAGAPSTDPIFQAHSPHQLLTPRQAYKLLARTLTRCINNDLSSQPLYLLAHPIK